MASFNGEVIHAAAVRMRVLGAGNLRLTLFSLSNTKSKVIAPMVMQAATDVEPTKPTNFNSQRMALMIKTTSIDEVFNVSKIVVFVKPVASGWPGSSS